MFSHLFFVINCWLLHFFTCELFAAFYNIIIARLNRYGAFLNFRNNYLSFFGIIEDVEILSSLLLNFRRIIKLMIDNNIPDEYMGKNIFEFVQN